MSDNFWPRKMYDEDNNFNCIENNSVMDMLWILQVSVHFCLILFGGCLELNLTEALCFLGNHSTTELYIHSLKVSFYEV